MRELGQHHSKLKNVAGKNLRSGRQRQASSESTIGYTSVHPHATLRYMAIKDSGMRIRVERDLREAFVQACRAQDRVAADVLRDFMRAFAEKQHSGQGYLFSDPKRK